MNKVKQQLKKLDKQKVAGLAIVTFLTILGVGWLFVTHANGPYTSSEAETGALSGSAAKRSDPTSSGTGYVCFDQTIPSKILGAYSGYENIAGL